MLFKDIIGAAAVKEVLLKTVKSGKIAHAQLFLGKEGNAQLALALAYITYLLCEDKQGDDACGRCAACFKMNKLIHPDVHFVFPVSNVGKISKPKSQDFLKEWRSFSQFPYGNISDWQEAIGAQNKLPAISAEEARGIISTLALKPFEASYKILLMWLPEYMNITAANAILKVLEEPPPKTIFLLVSQNAEQLLVTILSRVQLIQIPAFEDREVKQYLEKQEEIEEIKAMQIANLAEGNLRKAQHLLAEVQDDNHTLFRDWMRLCYGNDYTALVKQADDFASKYTKEARRNLLQYGLSVCREALVWQYGGTDMVRLEGEGLTFIKGFAKVINEHNVTYLYGYLNDALLHLERNASPKIVFLDISLKIAQVIRVK
ncbi:MAG: ATP-binding protein [Thermonemataceae bacterium]